MSDTCTSSVAAGVAASLLIAAACAPRYITSPPVVGSAALSEAGIVQHVMLVSIDGLRPDAIGTFEAPTLRRLMQEGSFSLAASTILPSKTLPSHTSMLTGEPPELHGVLWNNAVSTKAEVVEQPTIFSVARARGYRTSAFFSKAKFHHLQRPGTLDYSQAPGGWFGKWSSDRTATDVEKYLEVNRPHILFVHLSDPDNAGHDSGWMGGEYGRAVTSADAALGRMLSAAERAYGAGNYSVIVTADHGGHDRGHGSNDPRDVMIPWITWGRGVKTGELVSSAIRTMDTASTVLWLLGIPEPTDWMGTPVLGAFQMRSAEVRSAVPAGF